MFFTAKFLLTATVLKFVLAVFNTYTVRDFMKAVQENDLREVEKILKFKQVPITSLDGVKKNNILHYATYYSDAKMVKFLLKNGGDEEKLVNGKNENEFTPLLCALLVKKDDMFDTLKALLEAKNKANTKVKTKHGEDSPLHLVDTGEAASLLIKHGADVNAINYYGSTPAYLACTYNNIDVLKELVKAGADLTHTNELGNSIFHIEVPADKHGKIDYTIRLWTREKVELLKTRDVDLNHINKKGQTPMMKYLQCEMEAEQNLEGGNERLRPENLDDSFFEYMLCIGADINKANDEGLTLLHMAATLRYHHVVTWLCKKGADANLEFQGNLTPMLYMLKEMLDIEFDEETLPTVEDIRQVKATIDALVDGGANMNKKDENGWTAIVYVRMMKLENLVPNIADSILKNMDPELSKKYSKFTRIK